MDNVLKPRRTRRSISLHNPATLSTEGDAKGDSITLEVAIPELGCEKTVTTTTSAFVFWVIYDAVDQCKADNIPRAEEIYENMASYGLYYAPSPSSANVLEAEKQKILKSIPAIKNNHK